MPVTSFSHSIKQEILDNPAVRRPAAFAAGLFLFARACYAGEVALSTEHEEIARLYAGLLRTTLKREQPGMNADITRTQTTRSGKTIYTVSLTCAEQRALLTTLLAPYSANPPTDAGAFLSGAYLACGNMSDPEKAYHLEFVVRQEALCQLLFAVLESAIPGAKRTTRRASHVVYYKGCAPIEDLLTLMGAPKASLNMIDIEMIKQLRNQTNRVVNGETANLDKTIGAAQKQVEDILLILRREGLLSLPEPLREVSHLRLDNPEASLRELAALVWEDGAPISRSALYRRFDKIAKIAETLRHT